MHGVSPRKSRVHLALYFSCSHSSGHLRISISLLLIPAHDPQDVIAPGESQVSKPPHIKARLENTISASKSNVPNQYLAQCPRALPMLPLLRAAQLEVHVAVDRHKAPCVLGLGPFEAHDDFVVDEGLEHGSGVEGDELCGRMSALARGGGGIPLLTAMIVCGLGS